MIEGWRHLRFWKQTYKDMKVPQPCLPLKDNWFNSLRSTPFDKVKVCILGQDPYHVRGHAYGYCFGCLPHVSPLPPSLTNIFKEYMDDLGYPKPRTGDLRVWAERGVLLQNTILTVEEGKPNSHKGVGWEKLTYEIIRSLSDRGKVCFILWGKQASDYKALIGSDCRVLTAPHPSPYSANSGFFGSKPFSKSNALLKEMGVEPVDWRLP